MYGSFDMDEFCGPKGIIFEGNNKTKVSYQQIFKREQPKLRP